MSQNSLTALVRALQHIAALEPVTDAQTGYLDTSAQDTARQALASITPEEGTPDHIADAGKMIAATLPEREAQLASNPGALEASTPPDVWREKVAATAKMLGNAELLVCWNSSAAFDLVKGAGFDNATDFIAGLLRDAIASISVQDRRGSVGEEDLGSVGPLAAPSVPSPSLSDEPATPCDEYVSRETAEFLWDLLDDIDTVSDIAKGNDGRYRRLVEPIQARRFLVGKSDGYRIKFGRFEGCAIKPEADGEASKREARGRPNTDLPPSQGEPES